MSLGTFKIHPRSPSSLNYLIRSILSKKKKNSARLLLFYLYICFYNFTTLAHINVDSDNCNIIWQSTSANYKCVFCDDPKMKYV